MTNEKIQIGSKKQGCLPGCLIIGAILLIITLFNGSGEKSVPVASQETQVKELTPKQKTIQDFLAKELKLDDELQRGNDEFANAASEFDAGVPLPYIIKAELIFENVLEESKALVAPPDGEKVKTYLIEATNNALLAVKKIREGLESYPLDEVKIRQGITLYNKAQMPLAKKNAEIDKLKNEAGI